MNHLLYIDPGSGSYLVQVIVAAVLGVAFFFKNIVLYIKHFFYKLFGKKEKIKMHEAVRNPASYRDPSGYVFSYEGKVYRQVNKVFEEEFNQFINSGFYKQLVAQGKIIPHTVIDQNLSGDKEWYITLMPEQLLFVSYPYEWPFDLLKDAALLTIDLALEAMNFGLLLKDATPFNIQLYNGKPTLIDSLSFEKYNPAQPWVAYRQFCETFLAPLALMHYSKLPLQQLLIAYPDGIPLAHASKLLPRKSKWNLHLYLNLHLQARYSRKSTTTDFKIANFSPQKLKKILLSLKTAILSFDLSHKGVWSSYYEEAEKRGDYFSHKKHIIQNWISTLPKVQNAIDVGANDGSFSQLLITKGIYTISADSEHSAINHLYNAIKKNSTSNNYPLVIDFTNPPPGLGTCNKEHPSFLQRVSTDLVICLAFIHHLAIGKNIPFSSIAEQLYLLGEKLIIEYVPREDEKVKLMLQQKKDIYDWYTLENFRVAFNQKFQFLKEESIKDSERKLFLLQRK